MHEFGLAQNLVAIAAEFAGDRKVLRVSLEIGQLTAVMPEAIRFCYDICCQGTVLEGSVLEMIEVPGRGRCRQCGMEMLLDQPYGVCECGSSDLELVQGQELHIKELEMEELCA